MHLIKRPHFCLLFVFLCAAGCSFAPKQATEADIKPFVADYVAAYNAKDAVRLESHYSSKSRACIAAEDKDFYNNSLAMMWRDTIPADYNLNVVPVNEGNLKALETFGSFPVKPEREAHVDYQQGDDAGSVIVYLTQENGKWYADQPCASESSMKQWREEAPARKEFEDHIKSIAAGIQEPLRSQLLQMLHEHKTGDATTLYKESSGQDYKTAMYVIDVLAHEPKP